MEQEGHCKKDQTPMNRKVTIGISKLTAWNRKITYKKKQEAKQLFSNDGYI